jgi:IPTL-CTERM motif
MLLSHLRRLLIGLALFSTTLVTASDALAQFPFPFFSVNISPRICAPSSTLSITLLSRTATTATFLFSGVVVTGTNSLGYGFIPVAGLDDSSTPGVSVVLARAAGAQAVGTQFPNQDCFEATIPIKPAADGSWTVQSIVEFQPANSSLPLSIGRASLLVDAGAAPLVRPAPTLSTWALIVLGLLAAGGGAHYMRRGMHTVNRGAASRHRGV